LLALAERGSEFPILFVDSAATGIWSGCSGRKAISQSSSPLCQSKKESGSFTDFRFSPNTAAVARNDALYGCQTDPGTGKFRVAMQSLERCEKPVGIGHIESSAVVTNTIDCFTPIV